MVGAGGAVFESERAVSGGCSQAPLFADIGNVDRAQGCAGVIGVAGAINRNQCAASQAAQSALGIACGAIAKGVTSIAAASIDCILLIVASTTASLGHEPARDCQVVGRAACRRGKRIEILGVSSTR